LFRDCIEWCSQTITPRYPNFRFTHADVAITMHNPDAKVQSKDYTFPYGDGEFDFVFLISVFTHMLPEGFERYLSEIARVLKAGGRVMATFLLLTDDTLGQVEAASSPQQPLHDFGHYRLSNLDLPENTVAYREDHVRPLFDRLGLEIIEVTRGDWATKEHPAKGTQDAVLAVKAASGAGPT
jgi:SAM-dependent methyltransferase